MTCNISRDFVVDRIMARKHTLEREKHKKRMVGTVSPKRRRLSVSERRMCAATQEQVTRLNWSQADLRFVIEPQDEDRFVMTKEEVIEACRVYDKAKRGSFQVQFKNLINHLCAWSYARQGRLAHAFLTLRESRLLFLVVTKGTAYDDQFENELTALDIEIANSDAFSEISLSVQSLPNCGAHAYRSFCKPSVTIQFGGVSAK